MISTHSFDAYKWSNHGRQHNVSYWFDLHKRVKPHPPSFSSDEGEAIERFLREDFFLRRLILLLLSISLPDSVLLPLAAGRMLPELFSLLGEGLGLGKLRRFRNVYRRLRLLESLGRKFKGYWYKIMLSKKEAFFIWIFAVFDTTIVISLC